MYKWINTSIQFFGLCGNEPIKQIRYLWLNDLKFKIKFCRYINKRPEPDLTWKNYKIGLRFTLDRVHELYPNSKGLINTSTADIFREKNVSIHQVLFILSCFSLLVSYILIHGLLCFGATSQTWKMMLLFYAV